MSEPRRATVMLIQRGDPQIGAAIMRGVIAGRAEARGNSLSHGSAATAPSEREPRREPFGGEGQTVESVEIVTVEQDKWRRVARQVRIAVGNDRTAEDYRQLIVKARGDYAVQPRRGALQAFTGKLLLAWALLWEGVRRAYRLQDKVLK